MLFRLFRNCLFWVLEKQKRDGGYVVSRPTVRRGIYRLIRGKHYLWLPPECPVHKTPCPFMESYVPPGDLPLWKLPVDFEGCVVKGDLHKKDDTINKAA
jgi:hypothetical protein